MKAAPQGPDPLKSTGIAFTAIGAASIIVGASLMATAEHGASDCGLTGCFEHYASGRRAAGGGMVAAGLGLALVGAPLWLVGSMAPPDNEGPRSSEGMLGAAVTLTVLGVLATGIASGTAAADRREDYGAATIPLAIVGTTILLTAVPLWAAGTRRTQLPRSPFQPPLVRRSSGEVVGAITLATIGASFLGAGAIVTSIGGGREDAVKGVGLGLGLGGLTAIGAAIPLWIHGARRVQGDVYGRSIEAAVRPSFAVGPGSAMMKLSF